MRRFARFVGVVAAVIAAGSVAGIARGAASPITVAYAMSLRPSDIDRIPGLAIKGATHSTQRQNALLNQCSGGDVAGHDANFVEVQTYVVAGKPLQVETITSVVVVKASASAAARDVAQYRTPSFVACAGRSIAAGIRPAGSVARVQTAMLPFPGRAPQGGGFGWRATVGLRGKGAPTFVEDMRGFALGPYEVVIVVQPAVVSGPNVAFPANVEQTLLSTVLVRATSSIR
jgi:hypothetical protein